MAGRGNIANLRPFPKGKSGNPGGKPKEQVSFEARARKLAAKALDKLEAALDSSDPDLAARAAQQILDRAFGRPGVSKSDLEARKLTAEVKVLEAQVVEKQGADTDKPATEDDIRAAAVEKYGQEPANAETGKPQIH
jgi:hypothetical protein